MPLINKSPKFWDNFRLNLALSEIKKSYLQDLQIDWSNISPELCQAVNRLSVALKDCIELSNQECKKESGE